MKKVGFIIILLYHFPFLSKGSKCYTADSSIISNNHSSINLLLGTTGVGLGFTKNILDNSRLSIHANINFIGYGNLYSFEYNKKSIIKIDPNLKIGITRIGLNYLPFRRGSVFVTTGMAYLYKFNTTIISTTETGLDISGTYISPEDFGKINFSIAWNKVAPFIGVGFGRNIPRKRVGVGVELGTYYIGSPKLNLTYTGILDITNIDEVIPKIEKNMGGYAFLPYLSFKLNYRMFKSEK
jgi:hypothetical protein